MTGVTLSAQEVKEQVLWVAQEMLRSGLVEGTAGNVAARLPDGNAVLTPSSLNYLEMGLDDLVVCDLDGNVLEGERSPTTEKALHLGALKLHDDIHATMHCHAKFATMFALTRQGIPAVIEEFVVYIGGDVECADYRTTGTDDLGEEVAKRVGDRERGAHGQPRSVRGGQGPEAGPPQRAPRRADRGDHLGRAPAR